MLTERERTVLALTAEGWKIEEIGARLYLCKSAVETCRARVFDKLGARNAPHAVALAIGRGLIAVGGEA